MSSAIDVTRAEHVHDVAVVGAGPAGLAAALALAHVGADVALIGPAPPKTSARSLETRTAALLTSSVDLLKALNLWQTLAPHAASLTAIRIIDASRSLFRAPDIEFKASELGLPAFGYNIANTVLAEALYARAQAVLPAVIATNVTGIALDGNKAVLTLSEGAQLSARLVAGADGRRSICRRSAGIDVTERRYDQAAIATSFRHTLPHGNVSTELHQEEGSVTTVPLPDPNASSLIWVGPLPEIMGLMQRDDEGFADALSERLSGLLGAVSDVGTRAEFPVAGLTANRLAAKRTVLLGEAAHILPPIGAQGLNLGFRDAAALADCIADALREARDPGGEDVLDAYARARRLDVMTRTLGVDLLSRSLLTSLPPLQAARGIVLHGLKALPPLRRAVMRLGLTPPTELPSLMRPASG
ncbi:MAG: FAD-dependent monooxygenase [Methyloceanibacter sp.]